MKIFKMDNGGEWIRYSDGSMVYYPPIKPKPRPLKKVIRINIKKD